MITTTSLLDYIKQEDSLMKENDRNFSRKIDLLHYIDDSETWPTIYNTPKDELQKYKDEVVALDNREDEIREWNEDLAWYKANQNDFWIGVFIPDIFDQFEFIEYK